MSKKSYYNADDIIVDNDTGLELCLLETSGPFGLVDISRETTDQVKAFTVLPTSNSDQFKAEFMRLANLFWKLKVRKTQKMLLDDAKSSPNEIKAPHNKNETVYRDGHVNNLPRLDDYLVESAEVKLSSRISQVSEIYVSSLHICPDSQ
ncbi:hypothetical protein G6F37_012933 [Rhizopus arrhizus]|nr:hypothetical protein G6F38_012624 [Rhizopus arrhizus]KAG1140736.1 hypothetical protein G6F37_012933 [Rhizopus arrhizus]